MAAKKDRVVVAVAAFHAEFGCGPTLEDLAERTGENVSAIWRCVNVLMQEGRLYKTKGRGICASKRQPKRKLQAVTHVDC